MNSERKLTGHSGQPREITRLKQLWRTEFSDEMKAEIVGWFEEPQTTQGDIRTRLRERHKIYLGFDHQLTRFRHWMLEEQDRENLEELMADRHDRLAREHPDYTRENIREELLKTGYAHALASRDLKLGLRVTQMDLRDSHLDLREKQFQVSLRNKLDTTMDEVAACFKANPEAMQLFQQARALIAPQLEQVRQNPKNHGNNAIIQK